jgi:hypothetical protein
MVGSRCASPQSQQPPFSSSHHGGPLSPSMRVPGQLSWARVVRRRSWLAAAARGARGRCPASRKQKAGEAPIRQIWRGAVPRRKNQPTSRRHHWQAEQRNLPQAKGRFAVFAPFALLWPPRMSRKTADGWPSCRSWTLAQRRARRRRRAMTRLDRRGCRLRFSPAGLDPPLKLVGPWRRNSCR